MANKTKRILDFEGFINESYSVNEGAFKNLINRVGKWASGLLQAIKDGLVPKITEGPKKGLPAVMLFLPENGSIVQQMKKFEEGIMPFNEAKINLEYTGEDQSVRNISAEEVKSDVMKLYRTKDKGGRAKPIFIYGAPGVGKTEIVGEAAEELGVRVLKLDLQFMNPEDFLGIPSQHDIEPIELEGGKIKSFGRGFTRSNPPILLPPDNGEDGKGGIIFMDEMNRSNKAVLNSIMQFVQKGEVGTYKLPDKWVIVAAGNRPGDAESGSVADFDFALADRFTIKNYVPTIEGWTEWAQKNDKILPELVTFLTFNKELFHHLDPDIKVINFPTPRSWTDGALILRDEMIDSGAKSWRDIPSKEIYNIFFDQVGPNAAKQFVDYLDILRKITDEDLNQILTNSDAAKIIDAGLTKKSVLYGLMEMVLKRVESYDTQKLYNMMSYFDRYKQLDPLSWLFKAICTKYPDFKFGGTGPDEPLKVKAATLVHEEGKRRGLTNA